MELSWINTFLIAAKCGNFRQTAELLYISQPSVSVHIKLLEKELGVKLFFREGKRVKLTEEGIRYLEHATKLIDFYQRGIEDLQSFSQGFTTKLSLAVSPLIADTIFPFILKTYLQRNPQVEISIKILESVEIENAVLNDEVDMGLSCLSSTHADLNSEMLYNDKVILVVPHDGRDSESAPPLDEEDFLRTNFILTHNHPDYWDGLSRKIKNFYPNARMMKVSQVHISKRFISEGLGVSFLPISTVRRELLEGSLLEVPCHSFTLPEAYTYAIMKYKHSKQEDFLSFLSSYRI
ncbi:LysR family transcriptional regulator [Bacillus sp. CGMCC 1.16607]|uniref:LysR family transcriptional regulator n=1 Tax=Bacillus sp. CGMCC 1.16607 TaxID=3351842 RepID=UPI0036349DFE